MHRGHGDGQYTEVMGRVSTHRSWGGSAHRGQGEGQCIEVRGGSVHRGQGRVSTQRSGEAQYTEVKEGV